MTSKTRSKAAGDGPQMVTVAVVVAHDQLHRGEVGEVELTDDVREKLDRGYLRLASPREMDEAPPLGGTPAPVPGGSLLGVAPTGDATTTVTGGSSAASGTGNAAG